MKLGFGLYRHQLNREHYRFAKQIGATHLVVHYVDYFNLGGQENDRGNQATGGLGGWGRAGDPDKLWSVEELVSLRKEVETEGLTFYAIENFDPAHWYDVLLGGPEREPQLEKLKQIVRNVGAAGIPVFGYNFSLAGVYGRAKGPFARGGAESVGLLGSMEHAPIPTGRIWNMTYDPAAGSGVIAPCSSDELWDRVQVFLNAILPSAEEAGVTLAAHPDDPPLPEVRGTPRLVYQPQLYQRLIDINKSPRNQLEFCLGTIAEMSEGDVYSATQCYASQKRIAYIHFRNVRGKVPNYVEAFVDDGDIDMRRIIHILRQSNFDGVLIPDHTPLPECPGSWYAGMAYAMGYMRCLLQG